jgi:hypothetical protein
MAGLFQGSRHAEADGRLVVDDEDVQAGQVLRHDGSALSLRLVTR